MDTIRVLIVDDHPMVRRGLRSLLASCEDIHVVGEAESGAAALQAAADLSPDLILLDIQMPGPDGVEVAYQLRQRVPQTKIVILTAFENDEYLLGALRAGVHGYLLKSASDETLIEVIRHVCTGRRLLSRELMDRVLCQFETLAKSNARYESELSKTDLTILEMISHGATYEEIAKKTFWSERSVKRRVEEIIEKMGAKNRAQALAEAIKRGLI